MNFDITTPDKAYEFFNRAMMFDNGEWIDKVILECNGDIEVFIQNNINQIAFIDIATLKFTAFHLTTSSDGCSEIKKSGLMGLRDVLSSDTELNRFLRDKELIFNIPKNKLCFRDKEYDIDYTHRKQEGVKNFLEPIAHRLCYDPQVNGFFCCDDLSRYSTCTYIQKYL